MTTWVILLIAIYSAEFPSPRYVQADGTAPTVKEKENSTETSFGKEVNTESEGIPKKPVPKFARGESSSVWTSQSERVASDGVLNEDYGSAGAKVAGLLKTQQQASSASFSSSSRSQSFDQIDDNESRSQSLNETNGRFDNDSQWKIFDESSGPWHNKNRSQINETGGASDNNSRSQIFNESDEPYDFNISAAGSQVQKDETGNTALDNDSPDAYNAGSQTWTDTLSVPPQHSLYSNEANSTADPAGASREEGQDSSTGTGKTTDDLPAKDSEVITEGGRAREAGERGSATPSPTADRRVGNGPRNNGDNRSKLPSSEDRWNPSSPANVGPWTVHYRTRNRTGGDTLRFLPLPHEPYLYRRRRDTHSQKCNCKVCDASTNIDRLRLMVNVAYNKKAVVSSRQAVGRGVSALEGCGAVNGLTDSAFRGENDPRANCIHTADWDTQGTMFEVDLCGPEEGETEARGPYTLPGLTIVRMNVFSDLCQGKLDLVFLLDGSRSVRAFNFMHVTRFLVAMVGRLKLGADKVRVGVVTFDSDVMAVLTLNDSVSVNDVRHVDYIGQGEGNLTKGLEFLRTESFSTALGNRLHAPDIAVVVVHYIDDRKGAVEQARLVKAAGISLFVVGVGKEVTPGDLSALASQPASKYALHLKAFAEMQGAAGTLLARCDDWGIDRFLGVTITVDAQICHEFPDYAEKEKLPRDLPMVFYQPCRRPLTGCHVRLQKRDGATKGALANLNFCELQVWACEVGFYMDQATGRCVQCPYHSAQCTYRHCDNYYGCQTAVTWNLARGRPVSHSGQVTSSSGDGATVEADAVTDGDLGGPCLRLETTAPELSPFLWYTVHLPRPARVRSVELIAPNTGETSMQTLLVLVHWGPVTALDLSQPPATSLCVDSRTTPLPPDRLQATRECRMSQLQGREVSVVQRLADSLRLAFCEILVLGYFYQVRSVGEVCGGGAGNDWKDHQCSPAPAYCAISSVCEIPLGTPCGHNTTDDKCGPGKVCASNSVCQLRLYHTCEADKQCPAGANCDMQACVCNSRVAVHDVTGSFCVPKRGRPGGKCVAGRCTADHATCGDNNTCQCSQGYSVSYRDFSCRLPVNRPCQTTEDCSDRLVCFNNTCKLDLGMPCHLHDDNGQPECLASLLCDSASSLCKVPGGSGCQTDDQCLTGAVCKQAQCRITAGNPCQQTGRQAELCLEGALCEDGICKPVAGQPCQEDYSAVYTCAQDAVCVQGVCSIPFKQKCNPSVPNICEPQTICDKIKLDCRRDLDATCKDNSDCASGTVCDAFEQCRLPVLGECLEAPTLCQAGARCVQNGLARICSCLVQGTAGAFSTTCAPGPDQIGGSCESEAEEQRRKKTPDMRGSCQQLASACVPSSSGAGTCHCLAPFSIERSNYTCSFGAGQPCVKAHDAHCVTGTVCCPSRNICVLEVGHQCEADSSLCRHGTSCIRGVCVLNAGENCNDRRRYCTLGTVCDAVSVCRTPVRGECEQSTDCVAGAVCSEGTCQCDQKQAQPSGLVCEPVAGQVAGRCEDNDSCVDKNSECFMAKFCNCRLGYQPDQDLKCRLRAGESCSPLPDGANSTCAKGLYCDLSSRKCRSQLGQRCRVADDCVTSAVCDGDGTCRLDTGADCRGDRERYCKTNTVCDIFGTCRLLIGQRCDSLTAADPHGQCRAGGLCLEQRCICDSLTSHPTEDACLPKVGMVSASCESGECRAAGAQCVNSLCACPQGLTHNQTFACWPVMETSPSMAESSAATVVIIVVLSLGLLGVSFGTVLHINRKAADIERLKRLGMERLEELRHLNDYLEDLEYENAQKEKKKASGREKKTSPPASAGKEASDVRP